MVRAIYPAGIEGGGGGADGRLGPSTLILDAAVVQQPIAFRGVLCCFVLIGRRLPWMMTEVSSTSVENVTQNQDSITSQHM